MRCGLVIDEAIVDVETKDTKTIESAGIMYLTPDLELELKHHLDTLPEDQTDGLFQQPGKVCQHGLGTFSIVC
jgi:hypothetical protein